MENATYNNEITISRMTHDNAKSALMSALSNDNDKTDEIKGKSELKISTDNYAIPSGPDDLTLSCFHWEYLDSYDDPADFDHQCKRAFLAWCLKPSVNNLPSEQVLLRIHNVPSVICLKLPNMSSKLCNNGGWTTEMVNSLCESIQRRGSVSGFIAHVYKGDLNPIYYYQSKPDHHLYLYYEKDMRQVFSRTSKYAFKVFGYDCIVEPVNTQIEAYRWLLNYLGLKYTQWFKVSVDQVKSGGIIRPEYKSVIKEYCVNKWTDIKAIPASETKDTISKPKFMVYDIEAHSPTATFPRSSMYDNPIICIGLNYNDWDGSHHSVCIINGKYPITIKKDYTPIFCVNEKELILTYMKFLKEKFWNIMTGYNIYTFDNLYVLERAGIWGIDTLDLGLTTITKDDYKSRKFGNKKTNGERDGIPYKISGRMVFDLFIYLTRDYSQLRSFKLDFVGREFIGMGKSVGDDKSGGLEPSQIHHGYSKYLANKNDILLEVIENIHQGLESKVMFKCTCNLESPCKVTPGSPIPDCLKDSFDEVKQAYKTLELISVYCTGDVDVTEALFVAPKLNMWNVLISFSEIMGISPVGLYIEGLQKRVLSQLIYKCWQTGFVLNSRPLHEIEIKGAVVGGDYFGFFAYLTWMDVKSMYPNIMIWLNICYTTLMRPEDNSVSDEDCNILMAEEDLSAYGYPQHITTEINAQGEEVQIIRYKIRFVKTHIRKGILPVLLAELLKERAEVTSELKRIMYTNPALYKILDGRQLALKVSANAAYGFTGAQKFGELPLAEASICTTQRGREINMQMRQLTIDSGGKVMYGDTDSVAAMGPNIKTPQDAVSYGKALCTRINNAISPLIVEFEKVTHCFFVGKRVKDKVTKIETLVNKKKNYMFRSLDFKTMEFDNNIKFKGVISAKKNAFKFVIEIFNGLAGMIFDGKSSTRDCLFFILTKIEDLFNGKIEPDRLCYSNKYGGGYSDDSKYYMKKFADKMSEYTQINSGDYIQYIYVNTEKKGKVSSVDIMMLYGVFKDNPGKYTINYMKYVMDCSSHIDDLMYSMYKGELDYLASRGMGYRRSNQAHVVTVTKPFLMLWNMLHVMNINQAIATVMTYFDSQFGGYVSEVHL